MLAKITFVVVLLSAVLALGCVRISGGTWLVRSAPTPDSWPEPTPVGEVEVKDYPSIARRSWPPRTLRIPGWTRCSWSCSSTSTATGSR